MRSGKLENTMNGWGVSIPHRSVDIRLLKDFAFAEIRRDSLLRELLLSERDELDAIEFIAKIDVWLKILRGSQKTETFRF